MYLWRMITTDNIPNDLSINLMKQNERNDRAFYDEDWRLGQTDWNLMNRYQHQENQVVIRVMGPPADLNLGR